MHLSVAAIGRLDEADELRTPGLPDDSGCMVREYEACRLVISPVEVSAGCCIIGCPRGVPCLLPSILNSYTTTLILVEAVKMP